MNLRNYLESIKQIVRYCPLIVLIALTANAQKRDDAGGGSRKIYGEATIFNNYVDKGVTQSDKNWALQSGFGYQMGSQARIGLWGSSIKLPTNSENLNLRFYFDVKMDFTTNSSLTIRYDFDRYFQSDIHNGTILGMDFSTFGYHVMVEQTSNWEATGSPTTWYGFSKDYNIPWSMILSPKLGYSQISASGYNNYFDGRLTLGYKFADVLYQMAMTYNSEASQFAGRGDMAFIFGLTAKF
jgi:uncharacterized protein (TIGR02001 family)